MPENKPVFVLDSFAILTGDPEFDAVKDLKVLWLVEQESIKTNGTVYDEA